MKALNEAESATELEAMCLEYSSWHPCQVSLSSTENSIIVSFGRQELEDMVLNKEEALMRLRFRSTPLQGDDCSHIEGEHVLSIHKSPFKSNSYDAKVEKVIRVRHSTRVYCRCTFMIKWLHQDLKDQMVTVPSSSIMKLSSKNINVHPTVAALLNSVKNMGLYTASPFPIMHEDVDVELDLNKLLGKQIEEINISAHGFGNDITVDIFEEVNAYNNGYVVTPSKEGISKAQVSHDNDQLKCYSKRSGELEVNKGNENPLAPYSSIQEVHSGYRSHISPLAARAALASLLSLTHKHITISGSDLFKLSNRNKEVSADATNTHKNGNANSIATTILSEVQKGFQIRIPDLPDSAEDVKVTLTSTRKLTRSAVQAEKDKSTKQGLEEIKSAHNTGLYSSEGNPTVLETKISRKKNDISKEAVYSPLLSRSNILMVDSNLNLTRGDPRTSQDTCVQMETSTKNTKSPVSTNIRRLTRSTVSSEEKLIVPESHGVKNRSGESRKKNAVSSSFQNDSCTSGGENKRHKSGAVRILGNSQQNEGKVPGSTGSSQRQKRKSTSSSRRERRSSPRLSFLPRTLRSQNKS